MWLYNLIHNDNIFEIQIESICALKYVWCKWAEDHQWEEYQLIYSWEKKKVVDAIIQEVKDKNSHYNLYVHK